MSLDQRIEDGLRQRPSDERVYSESLRRLVSLRGVEPVIGQRTGRSTLRRSAVPALAAFCMLLVLAAGALFIGAVGPWRATNMGGSPQASGSPLASGSPQASGSLRASGAPEASTTPGVSTSSPLVSPIQLSASVPSVALTGQIACWGRAPGFTEAEMAAAFASTSANVDTASTPAAAAMRSMLATTHKPGPAEDRLGRRFRNLDPGDVLDYQSHRLPVVGRHLHLGHANSGLAVHLLGPLQRDGRAA